MLNSNRFALAALVGLAAVFNSCSSSDKEDIDVPQTVEKSKVFLTLQRFGFDEADLTRATDSLAPHRIVFKVFNSNGVAVFDSTQVAGQQRYGSLDFELDPGAYTFVAVAHDVALISTKPDVMNPKPDVAVSIASPTQASLPEALVQDTFCDTMKVNIKPLQQFSADMELPRIISRFQIWLKDPLPEDIKNFKIVANSSAAAGSGNPAFDPSTGFALSERQYVKEVDLSPSAGTFNNSISLNLLLISEEQSFDIVATAFDTKGDTIASHTLKDVPMKRNRATIASGKFFAAEGSSKFSFLTKWEENDSTAYHSHFSRPEAL